MLDPSQLQRVAERLDARFGLDALWVFGSEARGTVRRRSDVDLAALFRRPPSALDLLHAREELADLLGRDVDLLDLEQASPILAMQVLRHGKLLVDANPVRRQQFVAAAPGRYEDLKIVRREAERALLERVRGGRP
ncbi:MAG: nucleotidyltransferase domain-containing protein [Candidatus Rokubacteria bacterium]|nr:nucleotidyltransferase domain-containing protein [Candidatus Rokubacteria bacterium]